MLFDQFRLFRPGGTYGVSGGREPTEILVKMINYSDELYQFSLKYVTAGARAR